MKAPKQKLKIQLLAITALTAVTIYTPRAHAGGWPVIDPSAILTSIENSIKEMSQSIANMAKNIASEAENTLGLASQDVGDTAALATAQARNNDIRDQREVEGRIQTATLNATQQAVTGAGVCNALSGAAATSDVDTLRGREWENAHKGHVSNHNGFVGAGKRRLTTRSIEDFKNQLHCQNDATQRKHMDISGYG